MSNARQRATLYLDSRLHRVLRLRAAQSDRSISAMVNQTVRLALLEDAEEIEAFSQRASEPRLSFETIVKGPNRRGRPCVRRERHD
jgi:plasmid stability protein